jgi:hypothetical protein
MWRFVFGGQWKANQSRRSRRLCHRGGKTMSALTAQNMGLICPAMAPSFTTIAPAKRRRRITARMRARA